MNIEWIPTKFCDNGLSGTRITTKNEKNNFNLDILYIFPQQHFIKIILLQIFHGPLLMVHPVFKFYFRVSV